MGGGQPPDRFGKGAQQSYPLLLEVGIAGHSSHPDQIHQRYGIPRRNSPIVALLQPNRKFLAVVRRKEKTTRRIPETVRQDPLKSDRILQIGRVESRLVQLHQSPDHEGIIVEVSGYGCLAAAPAVQKTSFRCFHPGQNEVCSGTGCRVV